MTIPTYEWFIDWADDDYASFQAAIPERHIVSYAYDSGNVLDVGGQLSGVDAGSGQITLLDTRGTYWGTGALDADVLDKPHAFKLLIDGEGYAEGRATPVLGISVGAQVRPVTWRLAGGIETNLRSYGQVEGVTGTLAQVTQKLSELSGLDISTTSELPVGKGVTLATNWGGIINRIATLTGTWPAVVPGNAIELLSASDVIARTSLVTIGEADNLTMRETGVGVAHGLALTRYVLPGYANVDDQVLITGADEDRYGRKVLQIPDWFTEKELPYVLAALQRWAQPPTLVQFEMEDDYATPERAKAVVAAATVGSVVNVVLPDRTGADVTYKTAILGLGLRGGYRSKPTRIVRGLSQLFDPGPPPIPGRGGTTGAVPPAVEIIRGEGRNTLVIEWANAPQTTYDLLRQQYGAPTPNLPPVVVSSGNNVGRFVDGPPVGFWGYYLRSASGRLGAINGPWQTGAANGGAPVEGDRPRSPEVRLAQPNVVQVNIPTQYLPCDIARTPRGDRTSNVRVIATNHNAATYLDRPGSGTFEYRVRWPSGSAGVWSLWSLPVVVL